MPRTAIAANTPVNRPRREVNSGDTPITQKAPIADHEDFDGDVIVAAPVTSKDYIDELAFNEEPVTIRISQSTEKYAPKSIPVWVGGKGAEVMHNGRWLEMTYLPVNVVLTTKRKYVAVLATTKHDSISTRVVKHSEDEENLIDRSTSSPAAFSIIEDKNPRGGAWLSELLQRAG